MSGDGWGRLLETIRHLAEAGDLPARLASADLEPATTILALHLDSLGLMTVMAAVADLSGRFIGEEEFEDVRTLADLAALIGTGAAPPLPHGRDAGS